MMIGWGILNGICFRQSGRPKVYSVSLLSWEVRTGDAHIMLHIIKVHISEPLLVVDHMPQSSYLTDWLVVLSPGYRLNP